MASSSAALLGATGLTVLLIFGAARVARRPEARQAKGRAVRFLLLFAALLTVQMAIYVVQELTEDFVSRDAITTVSIASTVAWGLAAQTGPAVLAALALSWCSVRLSAALALLRSAVRRRTLRNFEQLNRNCAPPIRERGYSRTPVHARFPSAGLLGISGQSPFIA